MIVNIFTIIYDFVDIYQQKTRYNIVLKKITI